METRAMAEAPMQISTVWLSADRCSSGAHVGCSRIGARGRKSGSASRAVPWQQGC